MDEKGLTMGASYWARWACSSHVEDLPNLLLSCILAEGYDLLSYDGQRQVFDRGGVMKKIAWSLNGGRWSDAPVDLTITYSFSPTRTVANFYWRLAVRPFPTTQKEQASFETWVRSQFNRVVATLAEQPQTDAAGDESPSLRPFPEHEADSRLLTGGQMIGVDMAVRPARTRTSVQYASTYVEAPPQCERCWKAAVAIPGTTGRYYCLTCRRHLPRRAGANAQAQRQ
jgi:hypothetical protein